MFTASSAAAQTTAQNEWTWAGGATPASPEGIYGSIGSSASSNYPGARESAMTWTDSSGNLWLFGGLGNDSIILNNGSLNDLWKYNPSTGEWTWMAGSNVFPTCSASCGAPGVYGTMGAPSPSNIPGGRSAGVTWTDHNGNFWLFGGYGIDSSGSIGSLNDLWEFSPNTNEWTWVTGGNVLPSCSTPDYCGPSGVYGAQGTPATVNVPGGRSGGVGWIDSAGNLWLFGGFGFDSAGNEENLNDLWEFNPTSKQWMWIDGSSTVPASCSPYTTCGQTGVYGTLGTPSPTNMPGGRDGAVAWADSTGNFWLFGGEANYTYSDGTHGAMNDLWKFSPTTDEWTWMGGNNSPLQSCNGLTTCSPLPMYGLWQTPAAANIPGARSDAVAWIDGKGKAWLFGGFGLDSTGSLGDLNDLWEFDPATDQWEWMSGSTLQGQGGSEGTEGTASLQTSPGGRDSAVGWTDGTGNLWLMGGNGYNPQWDNSTLIGDLWEFQPYTNGLPSAAVPAFSPGGGTYASVQSVTLSDSTPGAVIYYMINSNAPPTQYTGAVAVNSSETIQAIAVASDYADSAAATAVYSLTLPPPPAPTFDPLPGTYYGPQTVSIRDAESYATIYYTTDGSTPTATSNVYRNAIHVSSSETIQVIALVSGGVSSTVTSGTYTIQAAPPNTWAWYRGDPLNVNEIGMYGAVGIGLSTNVPGGRTAAAAWTDKNGNFWLFGGEGIDGAGNEGYLNDLWEYQPGAQVQNGQWIWMGGSSTVPCTTVLTATTCTGQGGVYGTLGQPAAGNTPGGRTSPVTWVDGNGNLWLFGGYGFDANGNGTSFLNDLWMYNTTSHQWTWISGSNIVNPTAVYGGLGVAASTNMPGGRFGAAGWIDQSGNFWLFGGYGNDAYHSSGNVHSWILNDLWMFNPSTNQWTWMGGTNNLTCVGTLDAGTLRCAPVDGVYGTQGTPATANVPGARTYPTAWTDAHGNFWLFGGSGYDSKGNWGNPNDLWQYNPTTSQWTWMNGSNTVPCGYDAQSATNMCTSPPQVLGTLGLPATTNTPAGGIPAANWVDKQGNLWLFGSSDNLDLTGQYYDVSSDLWVYSPSVNQWAWMGGDSATSNCGEPQVPPEGGPYVFCQGSTGIIGSEYQPTIGNLPSSRTGAVGWTDAQGDFLLFSGEVLTTNNLPEVFNYGLMNDLWLLQPSATTLPPASTPIFSLHPGPYVTGGSLMIANGMPNGSIYYTTDGSAPSTASTLYAGPLALSSTETVQAIATAPGYVNSAIASAAYTFPSPPPPPTFSLATGAYSASQTLTLSDSDPNALIYYTTDGTSPFPFSTSTKEYTQPIAIPSSETITAAALDFESTVLSSGVTCIECGSINSANASAAYTTFPLVATPTFSVPAGTYTAAENVSITDTTAGATIYFTTDGTTPTTGSKAYMGPILVSQTETLEAIATASGYSPSTIDSATYTINLPPADFTVASSPASMTVTPGQSGTASISITPANGFNSAVSFACSGLPSGATCSFSPATVTPSGSSVSTTLTVSTSSTTPALASKSPPLFPLTALAGTLLFFILGKRRQLRLFVLLAVSGLGLSLLTDCSGGSGSGSGGGGGGGTGTTPVTSTITITATSGSLQRTTTLLLTVN